MCATQCSVWEDVKCIMIFFLLFCGRWGRQKEGNVLSPLKGKMDRGYIYHFPQELNEQKCQADSFEKRLQGKTSSDLKRGTHWWWHLLLWISAPGVIILAERLSWCPWNQTLERLHRTVCKCPWDWISQPVHREPGIILAGGSPCSCLSRFPACRHVKPLLIFNSTCLCCSWNSKVSGQMKMIYWDDYLMSTLNFVSMDIKFKYSLKSVIMEIKKKNVSYCKICKHESASLSS